MTDSEPEEAVRVPDGGPVLYWLIAMLPRAYGVSAKDRDEIHTATWDDEDSEWHIKLNGSGSGSLKTIDPIGESQPSPARTPFPSGTFLAFVDGEALCCVHPDHVSWFTDEGSEQATRAWEVGLLRAVRDRLVELGLERVECADGIQPGAGDLPPARELVAVEQRGAFDAHDGPRVEQ